MWKKFDSLINFSRLIPPKTKLYFDDSIFMLNNHRLQARQARLDDILAILELEIKVYGYLPWSKEHFQSELQKKTALYIVVYDVTNLIAVVGIHLNGENGHITYLAVSPVWQKQGLGTYLLRLIINLAQKWHCVRLSLEVRKDNKIAQELYCRFGFVTKFVRPGYYQDVHQDGLNMILDLPIKQKKGKNFG